MNIGIYFYIAADTESHLLTICNYSPYYTMEITLSKTLPPYPAFVEGIRRAPDRGYTLDPAQTATALKNALRYIPKELHETLAPEFMEELRTRGRIYVTVRKATSRQSPLTNTKDAASRARPFR